jgi:regulator of sigma E protease
LDPEGPAQAAGIRLGDRLLSLNQRPLDDWQQVIDAVKVLPGEPVSLQVERDGQRLDVPLTLAARGEGEARRGYLGAGVDGGEWPAEMLREVRFGPLDAVAEGVRRTWTMSLLTLDSLKKMLFGELSVKKLERPDNHC